ncbi:MAG TPA: hypothetical protein VM121_08890 [Acidimicrobiales bacterium]|nr:hypothetical protein [Acidimicrobiales bacterium]
MTQLPRRWVVATLADVAGVRLGRQRSPKNHSGPNMRPYLRAANVTWAGLDLTDIKEMNFSEDEVVTYRLAPGDVVVAEASGSRSEVGKPAIWRGEIDDCCFQNTLLRVRSSILSPEYIRYYLLGEALRGRLGDAARGVGIHHLGAAGLSVYPIPVAPAAEQERIVVASDEQFSRLDDAERLLRSARQRLALLRATVLDAVTRSEGDSIPLGEIANVVGGVTKDSKRQGVPSHVEVPYLRVANVQRGFLDLRQITNDPCPAREGEDAAPGAR